MESPGRMVKMRRRALDISQEELAQRAGMTREWVSALERDIMKAPGREALEQLELALDVPRGSLLAAAGYRVTPLPDRPKRLSDLLREALAKALEDEAAHDRESETAPRRGAIRQPVDEHYNGRRPFPVAVAEFALSI